MHKTLPLIVTAALAVSAGAWASGAAPMESGIAKAPTMQTTTLAGQVIFDGTAPQAEPAQLMADPFCAGAHSEPLMLTPVSVTAEGGLADAVVWVTDGPTGGAAPAEPALLDQVGCVYLPHALATRAGQTILFRNSDQTLHNVNVQPTRNPSFNFGQPFAGMEIARTLENAEVGIPVRCDVHPWMSGSISVFDHPWFAVSDSEGRFRIPDLPEGQWTVSAWHEELGTVTLAIDGGAGAEIRFQD